MLVPSTKDFVVIAATIAEGREFFSSNTAHAQFANNMANTLAMTNLRFNRKRFIMACMPRAWVGTNKSTVWEQII